MAEAMTKAQKKAAVDMAWASYRAASQRIDRNAPWDVFLDADERHWRRYVEAERAILAAPEPKAVAA
jgi:methionyl-tRNA synthetase